MLSGENLDILTILNFTGWRFMTVFNWCENPAGTWQLVFEDGNDDNSFKKRDLEDEYIHYLVR